MGPWTCVALLLASAACAPDEDATDIEAAPDDEDATEAEAPPDDEAAPEDEDAPLQIGDPPVIAGSSPAPTYFSGRARLEPLVGTWFGANLDPTRDDPAAFDGRLGYPAATFVYFVGFPMQDWERELTSGFLLDVAAQRAVAVTTFMPRIPLTDITPAMAEDLADYLGSFNRDHDLDIVVRFAHEMNGGWYSWSQQPAEYIRVFRLVADAIHRKAPRSATMWAPSYAGQYPFDHMPYRSWPDHPDFWMLDTNQDGVLDMRDDAYLPYWPGDDAVDWVGLSLYHWGDHWPWGDNRIPQDHKFIDQILGEYRGGGLDESALTDFYAVFTEQHGKPFAITETAALYNPGRGGPSEIEIKQAWWRQVFADEVFERFPRLRMINWFEWDKQESEINGERIDWTVTYKPETRDPFRAELPVARLLPAPVPAYGDP